MRLLRACKERLALDAVIQENAGQVARLEEPLHEQDREEMMLRQKYGDQVPFLKGLLYITDKRSEGLALPLYKRWLFHEMGVKYAEAEGQQFYQQAVPPSATDTNVETELRHQKIRCFHPNEVVFNKSRFATWYQKTGIPESKIRKRKS